MKCILLVVLVTLFSACKSAPKEAPPPPPKEDMWTLLARGDDRAMEFFLGEFDAHAKDQRGRTPLHYAAELDHPGLAAFFIAMGAEVDAQDNSGQTPLGICAEKGTVKATEIIIKADADIHKPAGNKISPAKIAVKNNNAFLPAILTPATLYSSDSEGKTILHIASEAGNVPAVKTILAAIKSTQSMNGELVAAGNRINAMDKLDLNGYNPLDIALALPNSRDHMEVAEQLILSGSVSNNPIYGYFSPAVRSANYDLRMAGGMAPLHYAAVNGHEGMIHFLLEKKANVNIKNSAGSTPLHEATRSGDTKVISLLLDNGADIDAQDAKENSPLHIAVPPKNHPAVIKLFLERKANPNLRDEHGNTPLHVMIMLNRETGTISALLDAGVDINVRNIKGQTPLHLAVHENRLSVIPFLLASGSQVFAADNAGVTPFDRGLEINGSILDSLITKETTQQNDNHGNTMLHVAIRKNADIATIKKIIDRDVYINARNRDGDTALHIAARANQREAGELILSAGNADIFSFNSTDESPLKIALTHSSGVLQWMFTPQTVASRDGMGNTMLHYVAQWKYNRFIPFVIQKGVHVESANAIGETPLFFAAKYDGPSTIKTLIASKANVHARDSAGNSALHSAVRWNAKNAVITLLDEGIDVNTHNLSGTTPLHDSVGLGLTEIAVILLDRKAELEIRDTGGNTPFMVAVRSGYLSSVELLAKYKANPMTRNTNGDTPLHFAVQMEHIPMIQALLKMNVSIHARNTRNKTPFQIALAGSPQIVSTLLTPDRINNPDDFGNSPLHVALYEKVHPVVLNIIINKGTSLKGVDSNGRIPLRLAVDVYAWDLAKILADAGSDPFAAAVDGLTPAEITLNRGETPIRAIFSGGAIKKTDSLGNTALHYAARMGKPDTISLLLELGADKNSRNISAEKPSDVALRWNNRENAVLLN